MKKYLIIVISAVLFVFTSCEKENPANLATETQNESISDLSQIKVSLKDGALHFTGDKSYFAAVESISNASPEQLEAWENKLGFQSVRAMYSQITAEIETYTSESQFNNLLTNNSHLIYVSEDDEILPKIQHPYFAAVANENGIFYVGESIFKVFPEKVIEVRDGNLNSVRNIEEITKNSADGSILVYDIKKEVVSRNCNSATYGYKQTSNRKVHVDMYTTSVSCGCGYYRVLVTTRVWGQKKNVWGNWKDYKTSLNFECGAYTVNVAGTNYSYSNWSAGTTSDAKSLTRSRYEGPQYPHYISGNFQTAKSRATSRGVGTNWAVICCGFGSSCPSATGGWGLCN